MLNTIQTRLRHHSAPSKNKRAIILAVDDDFFPFSYFVAMQILELHPDRCFDVCICVPNLKSIPEYLQIPTIRLCEINITGIEHLPTDHLSIAAYYRFFLPKIFAKEYEYILYLDADVFITESFANELFTHLPTNFVLAAAPDITYISLSCDNSLKPNDKENLKNILKSCSAKHVYRNSGVLLFNVPEYNARNYFERIFEFALRHPNKLIQHDQSAMNMALDTDLSLLSYRYNWQSNRVINYAFDTLKPTIIHFIRDQKPWLGNTQKLPSKYRSNYITFFEKYFPDLLNSLETRADLANREKSKHRNPIRRSLSQLVRTIKLKTRITEISTLHRMRTKKTIEFISELNKRCDI